MKTIDLIIICGFNLFSFVMGAKIGQMIVKGKEIKVNPVNIIKDEIKENKMNKEESLRKRKFNTMWDNIEKYDGTGLGQKQIPRE